MQPLESDFDDRGSVSSLESDSSPRLVQTQKESGTPSPAPKHEEIRATSDEPLASALHDPSQDTETAHLGFLPVLKNPNFLALWSGQVFSQLADKVYLVLMIGIISSRFQGTGQSISGWVSGIMIALTIPAVFFGSLAGVYVDRHPKQRVLVWSNLLRGGLVLLIPALLTLAQHLSPLAGLPIGFLLLLLITFLVSTLTQFFAPAEQATIPLLVEQRYLLSANSLYTTTMMGAMITGFAIGEPLLDWADRLVFQSTGLETGKPLVVGSSYALAGLVLLLIRVKEPLKREDADSSHVLADLQEGLTYLRQNSRISNALIQLVILFSVFAALAVLAVRLAEVIPELDADQFGWLLSVGSLGMALGAVFVGQFGSLFRRRGLVSVGRLGLSVALAALAIWHEHLWATLGCLGMSGLCAAFVGIPMQTTIQEETPPAFRGKVFGLQNNAVNIALSLPLALAGVAESLWGLGLTFFALTIVVLLGGSSTGFFTKCRQAREPINFKSPKH
jgi:MFS family permease